MRTTHLLRMTALLVPLALAGCGGTSSPPGDGGYDVKGTVVAVDPAKPEVTLDHEAIPGLMKPMKDMPFAVENPKLVEGIKAGDKVRFHLKKTDSGLVITALEKSDGGTAP